MNRTPGIPVLARNPGDVVVSIGAFPEALQGSEELQDRLAYVRAWYALRDGKNGWIFAPSKWAGYRHMTVDVYLDTETNNMDGRKTEALLRKWFMPCNPPSKQYDELLDALTEFLSQYGKQLNAKARITIVEETQTMAETGDDLVELIVRVVRGLDSARQARIHNALLRGGSSGLGGRRDHAS
jgi:hypothetical protein